MGELLTDTRFGLAQPVSWFASAKWEAAIKTAYARRNLCYGSLFIDQATSLKAVASELFYLCDGFLRAEWGTGLIEAGLFAIPEDIDPESLLTIQRRHLKGEPAISPETWDDVDNTWSLTFRDRDYVLKPNACSDSDINALDIHKEVKLKEISCKSIVRRWQAQNYLAEFKRRHNVPGCSASISVRGEHVKEVQPGQHIRLDIDPEPGGLQLQQVFRVLSISRDREGGADLTLEAERTLAPIAYLPTQPPAGPQAPLEVTDIPAARFFEAPWLNFAIGILASRPGDLVTDFYTHYAASSGGSYQAMEHVHGFALRGRLNAALASTDTGPFLVDLLDTTNRELISSDPGEEAARDDQLLLIVLRIATNGQIQADDSDKAWIEVFSCSSFVVTGTNQVSIAALRSRRGSIARTFGALDEAWLVRRADLPVLEHADYPALAASGDNAYFKLQPATLYAFRPLSDCAPRVFSFALNRDPTGQITDDMIVDVSPTKIKAGIITAEVRLDAADLRATKESTDSQSYNRGAPTSFFPSVATKSFMMGTLGVNGFQYVSFLSVSGWATGTGYAVDRFGKADMVFKLLCITNIQFVAGQSMIFSLIYRINGGAWTDCSPDGQATFNATTGVIGNSLPLTLDGTEVIEFGVRFASSASTANWSYLVVDWANR